jgi:CBS domain-containing protein
MTVKTIPLVPVTPMAPDASLMDALRFMLDKQINHVVVVDGGHYVGIVSLNHVLNELIPVSARIEKGLADLKFVGEGKRLLTNHLPDLARHKLADVVDSKIRPLEESCPMLEAALLLSHAGTPLAVVDRDGQVKGMLSRRALLHYLVQEEN